jgi:GTP-binding protein LepA
MVFAGLYPVEGSKYAELREALEKLRLNDASFLLRAGDVGGTRLRVPLRAFSVCCTWKSCRSGSSASSIRT